MTAIRKIEAAERQLIQAIYLHLENGDPIAVHTLVGASHQVIADLVIHIGGTPYWHKNNPLVPENMRSEVNKALVAARNFFKHADKDPESEIEFNEQQNEFALFGASQDYLLLGEDLPKQINGYQIWFMVQQSKRSKVYERVLDKYWPDSWQVWLEFSPHRIAEVLKSSDGERLPNPSNDGSIS